MEGFWSHCVTTLIAWSVTTLIMGAAIPIFAFIPACFLSLLASFAVIVFVHHVLETAIPTIKRWVKRSSGKTPTRPANI